MSRLHPAPDLSPALAQWKAQLRLHGELLDGIDVALCAFDERDRALVWNRNFLRFFPEHDGHVWEGEPYEDNLRRFYAGRLDAAERPYLEDHVRAGVARHRAQEGAYEFEHNGQRVQVCSYPVPGLGRVRVWRHLAAQPAPAAAAAILMPDRWRELLECAPDALVLCDDAGRILWANAAFKAFQGMTAADGVLGQTLEDVYARSWRAAAPQAGFLAKGLATLRENLRFTGAPFELPLPADRHCRVVATRVSSERTLYSLTEVTELKRAEAALQRTLESMSQGISAIDANGRLRFWNRRYQELLDLPDELLEPGVTLEALVRFQAARGDFGPSFSYVDAVGRGYVALGDKVPPLQGPQTYMRRTPDGRALEVHTRPLPDGGVVRTFTDMTAHVQAQEALSAKEALLSALVDNLPDRVWVKDMEGIYRLSNPAHRQFHGLREEDIVGRTAVQLFGEEEARRQEATDRVALDAHLPAHLVRAVTAADGTERHIEIVKVPMQHEDRCVGLVGIARDITERKRAEADLIAAREEALEASRAKTRFLSSMSHEIRTPMHAVLGMLTLLRTSRLTARQEDYAVKAEAAARSLLSLLNDVLDFSKIEAGKMQLEQRSFSLDALLGDLSVILSANLGTKPVELLYDLDPAVPDQLVGDDMRLRQILINLGGNAIKFTDRGEVALRTRLVGREGDTVRVRFEVCDSGIGISAEDQKRLFEEYVQAHASTARLYGGTGLGLGISRRLTDLMGTRLELDSAMGRGSCFSFTLTLPVAADASPSAARVAGQRVLVVDDNPTTLQAIGRLAASLGWDVQLAADGPAALQLFAQADAQGRPVDVVFLDWRMPGMDGWDLSRHLRSLRQGRTALVVMVSGQDRETLVQRSAQDQATIDAYLVKPVTASMLRDAADLQRPADASPAVAPAARPLAGLRLLVVDDNAVNRQIARELLTAQGALVETDCDGADAVARLASGATVDLVLMDMRMPRLDGLQATRQIRTALGLQALPILAMTANAMDSDRQACLAAGMNDHLGKPFVLADVVAAVLRHAPQAAGRPDTPSAPADAAPLLDAAAAIDRLGGDAGLYRSLLRVFEEDLQATEAKLRAALAAGQMDDATRHAHTIKGMAATMGAQHLSRVSHEAELRIRAAAGGQPPDGLPDLARAMHATLEALQAFAPG